MLLAKRTERACVLLAMREVERLPPWWTDDFICRLFQINRPREFRSQIKRQFDSFCLRQIGYCPECRREALLGCDQCFGEPDKSVPVKNQIAISKAACDQQLLPFGISDVQLSKGFNVHRDRVSRAKFDGNLCSNCGNSGRTRCLPCILSSK